MNEKKRVKLIPFLFVGGKWMKRTSKLTLLFYFLFYLSLFPVSLFLTSSFTTFPRTFYPNHPAIFAIPLNCFPSLSMIGSLVFFFFIFFFLCVCLLSNPTCPFDLCFFKNWFRLADDQSLFALQRTKYCAVSFIIFSLYHSSPFL